MLALARLSGDEAVRHWSGEWREALNQCFADRWEVLARNVGGGIRALLASPPDFEQAVHSCNNSLLGDEPVTVEQLSMDASRLLEDAIEPLERSGQRLDRIP